jgi:glycosyltransferase involved in cell wall biosynthesis
VKRPGLLFVINEVRPGGAEMFVIRLAKFMQPHFDIHVYSCFPANDDPDYVAQFREAVPFDFVPHPDAVLPPWREFLYWKLNAVAALFGVKGLYVRLRERDRVRHFAKQMKSRNIRVVNSSASHADAFAVKFLKRHLGIPAVISVHSAYNRENWGGAEGQAEFFSSVSPILHGADALLYTADHNLEILKHLPPPPKVLVEKVYLGYEPQKITETRADLGWPEGAFVVAMMARGIPEKGWQQAIDAFMVLKEARKDSMLVLIHTDTAYIRELKERYEAEETIVFAGFLSDPSGVLHYADCTMLPSHYPESLPYAITESLAYGTPVLATPVAEIPYMLATDEGVAGAIIPFDGDGKADVHALSQELVKAALSPEHLQQLESNAREAFRKFSMEHCGGRYLEVFNDLISRHG